MHFVGCVYSCMYGTHVFSSWETSWHSEMYWALVESLLHGLEMEAAINSLGMSK